MEQTQSTSMTTVEREEIRNTCANLSKIIKHQGKSSVYIPRLTAAFNDVGLFAVYGHKDSQNKEKDGRSNGGDFETVKGVERNAKIMQCGKRNDSEKHKFPKCFVSHPLFQRHISIIFR